ncbi:membrane protein [Methanosphaera sp. WGK6]|nr:membrane protein [Methanosphaera sp. WGK6]
MDELVAARKDYKLHLTILLCIVIAEYIGIYTINISGINIVLMPLLYSLVLAIAFYLAKPAKWIGKEQSQKSGTIMMLLIGPLLAKLAIASGQNIQIIFNAGPAILLQEVGNLGTIFAAMPIALLLGFKRESIGMTSSICREPQMAVVIDRFGMDSPETKGFFSVFLIGTVLGTPFISLLVSVLVYLLPLHPYAFGMACGIGSASMNAAAVSSVSTIFPAFATQIEAFSGMTNLISMVTGMYVYILIAIPLTEWLYKWLEPIINNIRIKIFKIEEDKGDM